MKAIGIWAICLTLVFTFTRSTPAWKPVKVDPCKIYGTVYIERDRTQADLSVYLEETESFADLVVFKEDNSLYADKSGMWYITDKPGLADFRIYIESIKGRAHFSIFYTNTRSFAGCP